MGSLLHITPTSCFIYCIFFLLLFLLICKVYKNWDTTKQHKSRYNSLVALTNEINRLCSCKLLISVKFTLLSGWWQPVLLCHVDEVFNKNHKLANVVRATIWNAELCLLLCTVQKQLHSFICLPQNPHRAEKKKIQPHKIFKSFVKFDGLFEIQCVVEVMIVTLAESCLQ